MIICIFDWCPCGFPFKIGVFCVSIHVFFFILHQFGAVLAKQLWKSGDLKKNASDLVLFAIWMFKIMLQLILNGIFVFAFENFGKQSSEHWECIVWRKNKKRDKYRIVLVCEKNIRELTYQY